MGLKDRLRAALRWASRGEPSPEAVQAGGHDADSPPPDGSAAADPRPAQPHAVAPVIVPRWVQMVVLPLALLALWALARAAGTVLLILIVASVVALILAPLVRVLERMIPRGLAILLVYLAGISVVVGIGMLLASPIASQVSALQHNFPQIVSSANQELDNVQKWLNHHGINIHIQKQGQTALDTLQKDLVKRSSTIVSFSRDLLSGIVTVGFDLILVLVLSIYLLVYGRQIGSLVRQIMPPGDGTPEDDFPLLVQHAVSGYVRGQLMFSLVMGASAALALTIFGMLGIFPAGQSYGVFFGAFYGLMEFIPYIGPIIGPVPAVLVGLFQNPISAVWLVLLFVGLQQLEGHVVAPQMFRISLRINPILIMLALLLGYQMYGIVGALVALPVITVIRQTVLYLRRHLELESWSARGGELGIISTAAPPKAGAGARPVTRPPDPGQFANSHVAGPAADIDRCGECGAPTDGGDAFCRTCGAALQSRVTSSR